MRKRQTFVQRFFKSPTVIASAAVVGVIMAAVLFFSWLSWLVFEERYGVGFVDFVRNFLF